MHTEHIPKLGWYEWVFVTPSNHRVHHAQNEIYLDRNYGGMFILWDRLFGSFQEELDEEPPIYGIRGPLMSWNPVRSLTHIYVDIARDSWHTRRWRDKLRVWIGRTGWRIIIFCPGSSFRRGYRITAARSSARTWASEPPKRPMGVRI